MLEAGRMGLGRPVTVIAHVVRRQGVTFWLARPVAVVLMERAWSVGLIEDYLASRLYGRG